MIDLAGLARLAAEHADDLERPVAPLRIGDCTFETDTEPVVMGVVNLSRDSTYRESVVTSHASAVRRGLVLAAQGAHVVDLGAESTNAPTRRVGADEQAAGLVPVIEALAAEGVATSIEGYSAAVVKAGLVAGARVVNLTGSVDDDAIFAIAAEYDAAVVLCFVLGPHARDLRRADLEADPVPEMLDHFGARIARARELGVTDLVVDPGLGLGFDLSDLRRRALLQTRLLLRGFRLRSLGVPVCQSVPHSFELFEEQFHIAEGFFSVLAHLGGTGFYRTHEVPQVVKILEALSTLDVSGEGGFEARR